MYDMNDVINSMKEVPAMPNVISRALSIMKDPESSLKELAKIISCDQSLSTKVLTLVNSSYYGFPQQITSISRAISLIGMSKAKNVILTVAMKPMLTNQGDKELWKHSIMSAVGCEYIAKYMKLMDPDEAFVIGFLHDLGKIILNMKDANVYEKVKEMYKINPNIIELEQTYFGTNHCQMGSFLATKWKLPLLVNNTIKYHHTPNLSTMPIACTLVFVVDNLVRDEFDEALFLEQLAKVSKMQIPQLQMLRENIIAKGEMLLRELAV